jgi:hypothetical protein
MQHKNACAQVTSKTCNSCEYLSTQFGQRKKKRKNWPGNGSVNTTAEHAQALRRRVCTRRQGAVQGSVPSSRVHGEQRVPSLVPFHCGNGVT